MQPFLADDMDKKIWDNVSYELKDLITGLLHVNPAKRISACELQ